MVSVAAEEVRQPLQRLSTRPDIFLFAVFWTYEKGMKEGVKR